MRISAALPLALALLASPAVAEVAGEIEHLPQPAGLGRLVRPDGRADAPLVVVLPDALGEDGRSEQYVDSLLARGIATLVLGLGEDLDSRPAALDPSAAPQAIAPVLAWAEEAGFPPGRTGILGFGLGGRAALLGSAGLPAAAIYPGCTGLSLPAHGPALVLQGDASAAGCDALPSRPGLSLHLVKGAGHGWDVPGAIWPSPGPLLPDPAGGERLRAVNDLHATLEAVEAVSAWFGEQLQALSAAAR